MTVWDWIRNGVELGELVGEAELRSEIIEEAFKERRG